MKENSKCIFNHQTATCFVFGSDKMFTKLSSFFNKYDPLDKNNSFTKIKKMLFFLILIKK